MNTRRSLPRTLFLLSTAGLLLSYGFLVGAYDVFPARFVKAGIRGTVAVWKEWDLITGRRPIHHLFEARHEDTGVTRQIPERIQPGLTLLAGSFDSNNEVRLIRSDGSVVRTWPARFFETFTNVDHIRPLRFAPISEWHVWVHGAMALPDGSVIINFDYQGTAKLDRCGQVLWTLPEMTHHTVEQSESGSFWIPNRRWVEGPSEYPPIEAPYFEDTLLEVSENGTILREIPALKFFYENDLEGVLLATGYDVASVFGRNRELVHLNDIEPLSSAMAEHFPMFSSGDLAVSFRNRNLVMVVDPDRENVKWFQLGPWIRQHDPDFLPDGTLSVLNNNMDNADGALLGGSVILRQKPGDSGVQVRYGNGPDQFWFTNERGKHQTLGNGNVLIVEAHAGRVFEVTEDGQVVWEFINRYDEDEVGYISDAIRYPEEYFLVEDWSCSD